MPRFIQSLEARSLFAGVSDVSVPGVSAISITSRGTLYLSGTLGAETIDVTACTRRAVGTCMLSIRNAAHPLTGQPWDQLTRSMSLTVFYREHERVVPRRFGFPAGTTSADLAQAVNPFSTGQWIFVDTSSQDYPGAMLFPRSLAKRVAVDGGAGNDTLGQGEYFADADLRSTGWVGNLPCTLMGGRGNDFLRGGGEGDVLSGGAGNDFLLDLAGTAGPSKLFGGDGDDQLINENTAYQPLLRGGDGQDTALYPEENMTAVETILNPDPTMRARSARLHVHWV